MLRHKEIGSYLAKDLQGKNIETFPPSLEENVRLAIFNAGYNDKFCGKTQVVQFWEEWLKRQKNEGVTNVYRVVKPIDFTTEVLQIESYDSEKRNCGTIMVDFTINKQGKVKYIIVSDEFLYYTHFTAGEHGLRPTLETMSIEVLSPQSMKSEGDNDDNSEIDGSDEKVLQDKYYNLGLSHYRESKLARHNRFKAGRDLLRSYACLNKCPKQNKKIKDLKERISNKIISLQYFDDILGSQILEDYDNLPF